MYRIWSSTKGIGKWLVDNTILDNDEIEYEEIVSSDAKVPKKFHKIPTHIKNILYLDCPDIIVEHNYKPIFILEVSTGAGSGHCSFQRIPRIIASLEHNIPAFYIYPERVLVKRQKGRGWGWDRINPLIFSVLENAMRIHQIPALLFYYPSYFHTDIDELSLAQKNNKGLIRDKKYIDCPDSTNDEMKEMFKAINSILIKTKNGIRKTRFLSAKNINNRKTFMIIEGYNNMQRKNKEWSPITATKKVETNIVLKYLKQFVKKNYDFGRILKSRENTLIYCADAKPRTDPYTGSLAALDYLICRNGKTFEDRDLNLAMAWGDFNVKDGNIKLKGNKSKSITSFTDKINDMALNKNKLLLNKKYKNLKGHQIPRYFMQMRFGSTFTKNKLIRIFSYFCDIILFHDGVLWREG